MNLRESPAVKNKIKNLLLLMVVMLPIGAILLIMSIYSLSAGDTNRNIFGGVVLVIIAFVIGFYMVYSLLKFRKLLKNIEIGNCIVLNGKGSIGRRSGKGGPYYFLRLEVVDASGIMQIYTSDYFRGKLARKAAALEGLEASFLKKPIFAGSVNKVLFDKVLAEDFTVYIDTKNPKNYFVDITPLYAAAEQK